jgi:hypothetical protein
MLRLTNKALAIPAGIAIAGLAFSGGYLAHGETVRTVQHTVTKTVVVTKTVPVVEVKTRTVVRTVQTTGTPSWYDTASDPEWECIGNLMQAYLSVVNGGPMGDPGVFSALCPNVGLPNG